jgi:hypothetical protein
MAHQSDLPPWLELLESPGVIDVLACLHNHGPADHSTLCAYVEPGSPDKATSPAVRRLAAFGMLQPQGPAGSLDQPAPQRRYELTRPGHHFALTLTALNEALDPYTRSRQPTRRRR